MRLTCYSGDRETNANKRISKRHGGGYNGEPGELVEVWYLAQKNLENPKHNHGELV